MGYQALLFCADEKTVQMLTQVLSELDFRVETCPEPFAAVKRLTVQHFDALVVDCDNEQNAVLLFKTARNSEINNASLSVAVVQGQGGIAKAFRIGANLVLTKPINVEQSKGTLRVARGLLRKAEGGRPAPAVLAESRPSRETAAEVSQEAPEPVAQQDAPPMTPPAKLAVPTIPMAPAVLELGPDPTPQPDAAEAAVLESLPAPVLAKNPAAESLLISNGNQLQTASLAESPVALAKAAAAAASATSAPKHPEVSQLSLAVAEAKDSALRKGTGDFGSGAATATAPAKEIPGPVVDLFAPKAASETPAEIKPTEPKKRNAKPRTVAGSKPPAKSADKLRVDKSGADKSGSASFSWSDAARDQETSSGADSKRNFFIAAVLVLGLAGAGYYSWPRLEPMVMSVPLVQKYLGSTPAPLAAPSTPPAALLPAGAAQQQRAEPAATGTLTQSGQPESTGTSAQQPDQSLVGPAGPTAAESTTQGPAASPGLVNSEGRTAADGSAASTDTSQQIHLPVSVPQNVSEGLLVKRIQPVYPSLAQRTRVAGKVQLQADIGKDGSVTQVKALSGDDTLAHAAMDAVRHWKYKPYQVNGQAVEMETQVTVEFKLPE